MIKNDENKSGKYQYIGGKHGIRVNLSQQQETTKADWNKETASTTRC
jgi:hypothetical protein